MSADIWNIFPILDNHIFIFIYLQNIVVLFRLSDGFIAQWTTCISYITVHLSLPLLSYMCAYLRVFGFGLIGIWNVARRSGIQSILLKIKVWAYTLE